MLKIGRPGHASVVVETEQVFCLMDPVLVETFDCGLIAFDPPVALDVDALRAHCNLVVLSHEHADHFDVRSLHMLDRDAVVIYPRGAALIERALRRLGFDQIRAVTPGEEVALADLRIIPTPSQVPFPEMGAIFESGGAACWNLVDTRLSEATIAFARRVAPRIGVLLAGYQPLVQRELCIDGLGAPFPLEAYAALLRAVLDISPRLVVPASCGFRYVEDEWLNDRGFPMDAGQFLRDLRAADPASRGLLLEPGAQIIVPGGDDPRAGFGELAVVPDGLPFVRRTGPRRAAPGYDWRPDRGVPPLRDHAPLGRDPGGEVRAFLDRDLLPRLDACEHSVWRERMARMGVWWRLEIVYPGGDVEVRFLDLAAPALAWSRPERCFPKIHTSVTASAIAGLLTGEMHEDRLSLGAMRVATRLYDVSRAGATRGGGDADEPLGRVLVPGARERFVERELTSLGV